MSAAVKLAPASAAGESLPALILARASTEPGRAMLRAKRLGIWKPTTGADLARAVADCAAGLVELGLKPGQTVGILARPSPEWLIVDLAIQSAGGVSAGFHAETAPGEFASLVATCATRMLFVDTPAALDAALDLRDAIGGLTTIVCLDAPAVAEAGEDGVIAFDALLASGAKSAQRQAEPWRETGGSAIAAIIPTSGLSSPSRAAQFTHAGLRAAVDAALSIADVRAGEERLSLMPASHAFERVFGLYAMLAAGVTVNFPESSETIAENLRELQPQILSGPPSLWSGFARTLARASAGATKLQHRLFEKAMQGSGLFGGAVLGKVRRDFGLSRVRVALSAGAPLAPDVAQRMAALGVPVTDVYALTEAGGAVATARDGVREFTLARGAAIEIAPDGELRLRTAALCAGYAGGANGFDAGLPAGDIAEQRPNGFALVGARETIVGGTSAWRIEDALAASPYILSAVVAGAAPDRLSAVILADYDNVVRHAQAQAIPFTHYKSLMAAAEIRDLIGKEVERVNATIGAARIADFIIADRAIGFGDPALGPAMNLRRRILMKAFSGRGS